MDIPHAGSYRIDPSRSQITFRTRHLFGLGAVRGTFRLHAGEIRVADPAETSAVRATVDAGSFHTGNPDRDRAVRSARLLDTERYPLFTFTSGRLAEAGGRWILHGSLTVTGNEHPVDVRSSASRWLAPRYPCWPVPTSTGTPSGSPRCGGWRPGGCRSGSRSSPPGGTMTAIEVDRLRKQYGAKVAVDDVSFTVAEGEIFGLLGRNGAGKSSTVDCVAGLRVPDH